MLFKFLRIIFKTYRISCQNNLSVGIGIVAYEYDLNINVCDTEGWSESENGCVNDPISLDSAAGRVLLPIYGFRFVLFSIYSDFAIFSVFDLDSKGSSQGVIESKFTRGTLLRKYNDDVLKVASLTYLF